MCGSETVKATAIRILFLTYLSSHTKCAPCTIYSHIVLSLFAPSRRLLIFETRAPHLAIGYVIAIPCHGN